MNRTFVLRKWRIGQKQIRKPTYFIPLMDLVFVSGFFSRAVKHLISPTDVDLSMIISDGLRRTSVCTDI